LFSETGLEGNQSTSNKCSNSSLAIPLPEQMSKIIWDGYSGFYIYHLNWQLTCRQLMGRTIYIV